MYSALQQPYEGIFKIEEGVGNHVAHPITQLVGSNTGLFPRLSQTELINAALDIKLISLSKQVYLPIPWKHWNSL